MKNTIILIFAVLLSMGCSRYRYPAMVKVDSTYIIEKVRYDTLTVPGDSVPFEVLIECDSATNMPKPVTFARTGKRASVAMELDGNGMLRGLSKCDSLSEVIEFRDKEIHRLRSELRTVTANNKGPGIRMWALYFLLVLIACIRNMLNR